LTIIVTALCGVIITSATKEIYGEYFWNPFELLLHIQSVSLTPAARAGTFFAGLAFLASQMALCIVLNAISTGMDMAALCPRWINIRRGCYILTLIAVAICPWNLVNQVTTFITVLSGWSIFLSGMTGILIFDYFFVRKCELHIGDMYKGNKNSVYWYTMGFNWRAILAWVMGVWPLLRTCLSPLPMRRLPNFVLSLIIFKPALFDEFKASQMEMAGITSTISATSLASLSQGQYIGRCTWLSRPKDRLAHLLLLWSCIVRGAMYKERQCKGM
jgi:cytosine/uracil/thiamine/allantoin permease